uniref:IS200/IS605 family transposase n=1 Tax=Nitrobacter sp. TaxID=29420 RepID=UPI00399D6BD7
MRRLDDPLLILDRDSVGSLRAPPTTRASSSSVACCGWRPTVSFEPTSARLWDCKYHIVWVAKYRFSVLRGDVGLRARELLREIALSHEMVIPTGAINRDQVHLLLSIPPHLSVSRAVQYLKDKSSHKLLMEYQSLRKR